VGGYAFGDSAPAARRLGLLADVFEPPSRELLERFAGVPLDLAVDLGCGPGHTTRLVASVTGARRTLGLDQSEAFVALAAAAAPPGISFAVHDVTVVPFPAGPAGLVYGRFLLSHLPDPAAALAAWATQLAPGGLLLVEEVERIHTAQPALRRYLDTAAALLAARGHTLEIGAALHRLPDPPGVDRRLDRVAPWPRRPRWRPSCSPRTWPSGAATRPAPGSRARPPLTGWPPAWPRSWRARPRGRSPGSCASSPSGGPRPSRPAPRR
jgi:trans-aconitate 2-methyltransferase